jgi:hypothetical protein
MATITQFDYTNQAWLIDGIYQDCGHKADTTCGCFGRRNKGKKHTDICKSDNCDVCHEMNIGATDTTPMVSGIKVTARVWSKGDIKAYLAKCEDKADCPKTRAHITRALLYMFDRQTQDEQSSLTTSHTNGIGFTGVDAEFLSSVATRCRKYNQDVSPKQFPYVRKKLVKYSGQLVEFANAPSSL